MSGQPRTGSVRWIAEQIGISKSQAGEFRKAGMPMEDAVAAREWLDRHRRTQMPQAGRPARGEREKKPPAEPSPNVEAYASARADRERTRAQRERMELLEAEGQLIDRRDVSRVAFTAARILRDGLEAVPDRIGDAVAAESDPFEVRRMLRDELRAVLASIRPEDLMREPKEDEGEPDE